MYAGVIAALAIVPVSIPLLYRLVLAENRAARSDLYAETARIGLDLDAGTPPVTGDALSVRAVSVSGEALLDYGATIPDPSLEDLVCGEPTGVRTVLMGDVQRLAVCFESRHLRVFAIYPTPTRSYLPIGLFAAALAMIAGIVTALGVLRILRPLTRVGRMLNRVGMGERGIRMRRTGILEVDHLIERMNALAVAVEEREHNILARVQVAQEIARLVAHEVRNPLQSMELMTSLLANEDDPAERRELTQSIHKEIRTLDDVVTRLLREGATRGSIRLNLQPVDVDDLIAHVGKLKQGEATRRGARILVEPGAVGELPVDRPLLSRSIENLVINALRAVPSTDGLVRIASTADNEAIRISVEDNGPGIDPNLGDAIFEANVSGEGGNGLGLSLTRGVAEAHGGSALFDRSPLGGARFILVLPRNPTEPKIAGHSPA